MKTWSLFLCFPNIWVNHLIYGEWWNVWMCRMDMLLVFQWPNLMLVLDDPKAFKSIQNLDIKCPFSFINILQSLKVKVARCMVFLPISRRWFCVFLVCNWIELCYGVKKVGWPFTIPNVMFEIVVFEFGTCFWTQHIW